MKAFRAAWRSGCHGIELDVQLTVDQQLPVFHDEDGMRLAGRPEHVAHVRWSTMSSWRVGGQPVPLLDDVLQESPPGSLTLIELKSGIEILDPVFRVMDASGISREAISVLSFDESIAWKAANRGYPVWLNIDAGEIGRIASGARRWSAGGLSAISCGFSAAIDHAVIEQVHLNGMHFTAWTVNHPHDAIRARAMGIDYLMTDDPVRMMKALADAR